MLGSVLCGPGTELERAWRSLYDLFASCLDEQGRAGHIFLSKGLRRGDLQARRDGILVACTFGDLSLAPHVCQGKILGNHNVSLWARPVTLATIFSSIQK